MWSREPEGSDKVLFPLALCAAGAAGLLGLLCRLFPSVAEALRWTVPCPFYALTGLYCPGCGGQRAVRALFGGRFLESLYYHPAVLPAALFAAVYLLSQGLNRLTKGKTPALYFRAVHLYIFLGLLILQWIVKNLLLKAGLYII